MSAAAFVRAAHLASLMAVFGASGCAFLFRKLAPPARLPLAALSLTALATALLTFLFVTAHMTGNWHDAFARQSLDLVATQSFFGQVFLVRIAALVALTILAFAGRNALAMWVLAGVALAGLGLTSHAAANGDGHWLAFAVSDAAHLLCAGFWVGGLLAIASMLRERRPDLVPALRVFSRWGTWAVALLVLAGIVNGLAIVPSNPAHWSYGYMTVLCFKVVLAAIMISLALANRLRVAPAIGAGSQAAQTELAWTVASELALGLIVILLAAFLGTMSPVA